MQIDVSNTKRIGVCAFGCWENFEVVGKCGNWIMENVGFKDSILIRTYRNSNIRERQRKQFFSNSYVNSILFINEPRKIDFYWDVSVHYFNNDTYH